MIYIYLYIYIIYSIKTTEPVFSFFGVAAYFDRYTFVRKKLYTLLINLEYSSAFFGDMPVEAV